MILDWIGMFVQTSPDWSSMVNAVSHWFKSDNKGDMGVACGLDIRNRPLISGYYAIEKFHPDWSHALIFRYRLVCLRLGNNLDPDSLHKQKPIDSGMTSELLRMSRNNQHKTPFANLDSTASFVDKIWISISGGRNLNFRHHDILCPITNIAWLTWDKFCYEI